MAAALSDPAAPPPASSPASPESAAADFLRRLNMPCRLLVAYSGGGDSTGLLVALHAALKARPELRVSLVAATVDHGLRPGSADEAHAAGALCRRLSIPHHVLAWDDEKPRTGLQAAAREARYRLLAALAREVKADLIVTAHNRDDQAETIAMRQGRDPAATEGMAEAVLYGGHIWICRPFLRLGREDIRRYLGERGVGWVEDPSNDNDRFERVRVRKALQGRASSSEATGRGARIAAAEFLRSRAIVQPLRYATLDLTDFDTAHPAHLEAVRQLAAFIGGRTHPCGRETTDRIASFFRSPMAHRMTAERVVFDRRKSRLYLTRERRALPELEVPPGATMVWDNRLRVANSGREPVLLGVRRTAGKGIPLFAAPPGEFLPGSVGQRVAATEPLLLGGRFERLDAKPIITQFDRFLPLPMFEIANALAFLAGLDHFPGLPTR